VPCDPKEIVRYLFNVPGLEGLEEVCRAQDISLTCHGGAARRIAALASERETLEGWDIFDCVPFSSDIDLVHSGSPGQTPAVRREVHRAVPFAEQLRWEILSREQYAAFEEGKPYSPIVPSFWIELSSDEGWRDPWNGLDDIATRSFHFQRNGFYARSPLYNAGRDVELISVLLYYKALLDVSGASPESDGLAVARRIIEEAAGTDTTIRLQESAYLRSRLRYALTSIKAAAPEDLKPSAPRFTDWGLSMLEPLLKRLSGAEELLQILNWEPEQGYLSVSSRIGGDIYRLPPVSTDAWTSGSAAADSFARMAKEISPTEEIQLESGQTLVVGSQLMECRPGTAPSAQDSEFVHFSVKTGIPVSARPQGLSAICLVKKPNHPGFAYSAPAACSILTQNDSEHLQVRCNLGRALSTGGDRHGRRIQVFVTRLAERPEPALNWISGRPANLGSSASVGDAE
jgi:hypothetical protein